MCVPPLGSGGRRGIHLSPNQPINMAPVCRQLFPSQAPGVVIEQSVPHVMAHYGFTTEDIGSHPRALVTVEKFGMTSMRPYVGERVFDSLKCPNAPIYRAIQVMCKEEACARRAEIEGVTTCEGGRTHVRWA